MTYDKTYGHGVATRRAFLARGAGTALSASVLLDACGSAGTGAHSGLKLRGNGSKQIGLSIPVSEVPTVAAVRALAASYGASKGWKMLLDPTQMDNLQNQLTTVTSWVTQGVPAICILPVEPSAFEPLRTKAQKGGSVWTTYALEQKGANGGVLFPADTSGLQVGEAAVSWINAHDPMAKVMIQTLSTLPAAAGRSSVPEHLIRQHTRATIVAKQDAATQDVGLRVTRAVLQAHPDLSVVIGFNDDGAIGAAEAFSNAGKDPAKTFIAGDDGSLEGLRAVQKGPWLKGTDALPLASVARGVVDLNIALAREPETNHVTNKIIPTSWVTKQSPELRSYLAAFRNG